MASATVAAVWGAKPGASKAVSCFVSSLSISITGIELGGYYSDLVEEWKAGQLRPRARSSLAA
jgi:hypothetical protein